MTKWILFGVIIVMVTACSTTTPSRAVGAPRKPLFIHLLAFGKNPGEAARRIASMRIYLGQDFSVSLGDQDNPFTNKWDGAITLPLIGTNGVAKPRPLGSLWNSRDAVLAGHIEGRPGKFLGHLQARNQTTLNYFDGEMELEKPVEQHGSWIQGTIWGVWFVLSESPDCRAFLRALDEGKLRSAAVVDRDSPEAKRWLEMNSNRGAGPAKAQPAAEQRTRD